MFGISVLTRLPSISANDGGNSIVGNGCITDLIQARISAPERKYP